jgi:hypothetical protein
MSPGMPSAIPLTREELVKLKHQIEPNDYLVVESGTLRIMVVRTAREFPDIVNDLDGMINKLDIRDTKELSHALIIGDEEVVGVPLQAIESLIERRIEDDERIAEDLGEKLIEPFTTLLFESENDPYQTLRLGIRVAGNLKDFKPQELSEILFAKIKSLPRHSEVVYLIAEDGYIRLSGNEFYKRLREFLKENPETNRELAKEFIYMTRGRLADHFVNKDPYEVLLDTGKQESINKFVTITESESTDSEVEPEDKATEIEPSDTDNDAPEPEHKPEQHVESEPEGKETPKPEGVPEPLLEPEPEAKHAPPPEQPSGREPAWKFAPELKIPKESETAEKYPSITKFIIMLQEKLPRVRFEVMHGVEIPGVDLAAKNTESFIRKVFFSYMPEFNLKKALALEQSMNKFAPELTIMVGVPGSDDSEMKLFAVGKNILITDIDTLLNTNLLVQLEEHI